MGYIRKIRDPIYGFIEISDNVKRIIDNPEIQRLRWVNQLPLEQLVYPSANHSRFEHSLGVMHLAGIAARALAKNSNKMLLQALDSSFERQEKDIEDVLDDFFDLAQICGLLHDIGHAPFSHTFEFSIALLDGNKYSYDHEEYGSKIVEYILKGKEINWRKLKGNDIIRNVLNKKYNKKEDLKPYEKILRNIIDYDFDVDKGDYLLRDSYHCGVNYGCYDYRRLWENICLVENDGEYRIFPNEKAASEVWRLLLSRYFMHVNVYEHSFRLRTDAVIMYIIYFTATEKETKQKFIKLFPFTNRPSGPLREDELNAFSTCNDQSFIANIKSLKDPKITDTIKNFFKRDVFHRVFKMEISDIKKGDVKKIILQLWKESKKKFPDRNMAFSFRKIPMPPTNNTSVNDTIRIVEFEDINENKYINSEVDGMKPLSKYLKLNDSDSAIELNAEYEISAFCDSDSSIIKHEIEKFVEASVNDHITGLNKYKNQ